MEPLQDRPIDATPEPVVTTETTGSSPAPVALLPTLTDDQKAAQPLLETFGVILLPPDIDHEAYKEMSWALRLARALHPEQPLELRCHGDGGSGDVMLAIVDLVQADGNVDGMLIGRAYSASSVIWAACARRYVYPNAGIGVHGALMNVSSWADGQYYQTYVSGVASTDEAMIALYAAASRKSRKWWRRQMARGHSACVNIDAAKLVEIGMARPVAEREG